MAECIRLYKEYMNLVDVNVYDNLIPDELKKEVWTYINNQTWYATWKPMAQRMHQYVPANVPGAFVPGTNARLPSMWMHRTCFASDDYSLEQNHPLIWKLWCKINSRLGDKYTITGNWEDMSHTPEDHPDWQPPATQDPNLEPGWRVYANGQLNEFVKRSHGIHRDTVDITDDTTRTILYVANLEWYPSWFAECIFYPDDPFGESNDHQQYQKGVGQNLNFNIGWSDKGKIVSPVPGRIIDYDGRTLHTTRPTAIWANEIRKTIAFRVRLKS
jgi:hypothetical protein